MTTENTSDVAASAPSTCSAPIDLRTRAGRREEVLEQIRDYGGFSIFWVTENHLRACVAQDMRDSGEISTDNKTHGFPWIGAKTSKQNSQRTDA